MIAPPTVEKAPKLEHMTRDELLALPKRKWGAINEYTSIVLVPSDDFHESGHPFINVVGVSWMTPKEIAAETCDLINFNRDHAGFRVDVLPASGCVHIMAEHFRFHVGIDVSTLFIRPGSVMEALDA